MGEQRCSPILENTMYKLVEGNLLDATEVVLAYGINDLGLPGQGVSEDIYEKYPGVYASYLRFIAKPGIKSCRNHIVRLNEHNPERTRLLIGMATYTITEAYTFGHSGWLEYCLDKALTYCKINKHPEIAIPDFFPGLVPKANNVAQEILEFLSQKYPYITISIYGISDD
jgi:hypothetical protein